MVVLQTWLLQYPGQEWCLFLEQRSFSDSQLPTPVCLLYGIIYYMLGFHYSEVVISCYNI